jgi:hypothetical protein
MFGLPAIAEDFTALTHQHATGRIRQRLQERLAAVAGRGACRHPDGAIRLARSALGVFTTHLNRHDRRGPCLAAAAPRLVPTPWTTRETSRVAS